MLFGDKDSFGIQVELSRDTGGVWLFGQACYWIGGDPVGDRSRRTSLRDVLFLWERISCDAGNRGNVFLQNLPTEELGNTLRRSMYGLDGDDALSQRSIDEQWARHEIVPNVTGFHETLVWLVEEGQTGRCVYKIDAASAYQERILPPGGFDQTLKAAIDFLRTQYDAACAAQSRCTDGSRSVAQPGGGSI